MIWKQGRFQTIKTPPWINPSPSWIHQARESLSISFLYFPSIFKKIDYDLSAAFHGRINAACYSKLDEEEKPRVFTPLRASERDTYFPRIVPDWDLDTAPCFAQMHFRKASECMRLYGSAPSVIDCEFTGSPRRPCCNNTSNHTPGNWDLRGLLLSLFDQARYTLCRRLGLFCVTSSHLYLFLHLSFCVILFCHLPFYWSFICFFLFLFPCQGWKRPSKFWLVGYTRKSDGGPLLTCWLEVPVPGYLKEYVTSFDNKKLNSHLDVCIIQHINFSLCSRHLQIYINVRDWNCYN